MPCSQADRCSQGRCAGLPCACAGGQRWRALCGIKVLYGVAPRTPMPSAVCAVQVPAQDLSEIEANLPNPFQLWRKLLCLGLIFFCASFNLTVLQNLKDSIVVTSMGAGRSLSYSALHSWLSTTHMSWLPAAQGAGTAGWPCRPAHPTRRVRGV